MIRILAFVGALTVGAIGGLALAWATSLIPGAIAAEAQPHYHQNNSQRSQ